MLASRDQRLVHRQHAAPAERQRADRRGDGHRRYRRGCPTMWSTRPTRSWSSTSRRRRFRHASSEGKVFPADGVPVALEEVLHQGQPRRASGDLAAAGRRGGRGPPARRGDARRRGPPDQQRPRGARAQVPRPGQARHERQPHRPAGMDDRRAARRGWICCGSARRDSDDRDDGWTRGGTSSSGRSLRRGR